jgi:hypothetical protein
MKAKALTIAGLCALAVALAIPASGAAATTIQVKGTGHSSGELCGLSVDNNYRFTAVLVFKANGAELQHGEFKEVWTNTANGKSIVLQGSFGSSTGAPIDNGDGTISFLGALTGSYIVKAVNGAPITVDAGRQLVRVTLDAATGDFVSVEFLSIAGPHPFSADGSCDSIVALLT